VNRFVLPLAAFGLLIVVLAVGVRRAPEKATIPSALIGKAAPAFVLPALAVEGDVIASSFDSNTMRGQWYALNVWGTWCAECRVEHDALLAIKAEGKVPLVGLNWKDDTAAAQQWLQQLGNPYAVIPIDANGRVAIDYGVYGAPETFLIDPQGMIRYRHVGALSATVWQDKFMSRVNQVAAAP
jgi:cytochrome c biogenesis protein CcmG/thiol:disulfide interchange protein DsbE